jgi:hypothetical protein
MQIAKRCSGLPVVLEAGLDNEAQTDLRAILDYYVLAESTVCRAAGLLDTVSVVICEDVLPDGTWRGLLPAVDGVHSAPALIITSPTAGPQLWAEVLNLGGYDVPAQPFSNREVLWSLQHFIRYYGADRTALKQPSVRLFGQPVWRGPGVGALLWGRRLRPA